MFAIHYFFVSEQALLQFLKNVSRHLKVGGHFFGTVPDGKRVVAAIARGGKRGRFESPLLTLEARWTGPPACFGSPYVCAIGDTVTDGSGTGTEGSLEYLVYSNVLLALAKSVGLEPVYDIDAPNSGLERAFDPNDAHALLKHFDPHFPRSDPSLEDASRLFAAFCFVKTRDWEGWGEREEKRKRRANDRANQDHRANDASRLAAAPGAFKRPPARRRRV